MWNEIKKDYLAGLKAKEILKKYKITAVELKDYCKKEGLTRHFARKVDGVIDLNKIKELLEQGYSLPKIAEITGYGCRTCFVLKNKYGFHQAKKEKPQKIQMYLPTASFVGLAKTKKLNDLAISIGISLTVLSNFKAGRRALSERFIDSICSEWKIKKEDFFFKRLDSKKRT